MNRCRSYVVFAALLAVAVPLVAAIYRHSNRDEITSPKSKASRLKSSPRLQSSPPPTVTLKFYHRRGSGQNWRLADDLSYSARTDIEWECSSLTLSSEPNTDLLCRASISGKKPVEQIYRFDADGSCDVTVYINGRLGLVRFPRPKPPSSPPNPTPKSAPLARRDIYHVTAGFCFS